MATPQHNVQMSIEGMEELDRNLKELKRSQAASVVRRALIASAKPTVDAAVALVPVDDAQLRDSIGSSVKLNPRQMRKHKKEKGDITVFVGPQAPHAHLVEFGTSPHANKGKFAGTMHPGTAPQPFMRPAWESTKMEVLETLKKKLWEEMTRRLRLNANAAAREAARNGAPPPPASGGTT